jgi:predicted GNAT superfamily acetyltransferase
VENVVGGGKVPRARKVERIQVPANISELKKGDPRAAAQAQGDAGAAFEKWFGQGYAVTGFELDEQVGTYLLEKFEAPS